MALITDPDNLSQGSVTSTSTLTDLVFASSSGVNTTITSSGSDMPALAVNAYFEIRDHSTVGNNGLYQVVTVNSSTASYAVKKIVGSNPANASSEAASMLGATGASTSKSVFFDTALKKIWLFEQGNLSSDGVTLQALYSFIKEEWKNDATLIPHPFPMVAITPEQFEFIDGWQPTDVLTGTIGAEASNTRKLIRTGGWKEYDVNDNVLQEWTGVVTLGTFEDSATDQAYYQFGTDPTDTTAATNFTYNGPVNEPIKVFAETLGPSASLNFNSTSQLTRGSGSWITEGYRVGSKVTIRDAENSGNDGDHTITALSATVITVSGTPFTTNADDDSAVIAYNHKSAIKVFLRVRDGDTNGKTFAQSELSDIGVTTVDNKVFRFPVTNATDLKITETDVNIAADSPYTDIRVRYFDQAYTKDVDSSTDRNFGIVIDVGTHSGVDGSTNSATAVLTSAEGGIVGATVGPAASLDFDATADEITRGSGSWITDGYRIGSNVTVTLAEDAANNGTYRVIGVTATVLSLEANSLTTDNADDDSAVVDDRTYDGGTLTIHEGANAGTYTIGTATGEVTGTTVTKTGGNFGNTLTNQSFTLQRATPIVATAEEIYEKVQYLLRQASDIDATDQTVTGKTADALLTFVGDTLKAGVSLPTNPNGGGSGVIIEGFSSNDTNRLVFVDNLGTERTYPFVAAGTINFNANLVSDGDGYYWMFFQYTERFTNTGFSIGSASGATATITSTTTNLTTELADGDYIALSGFATSANNGIWLLTGTPAGSGPYTVTATKVDGVTVVNESAGPSVSLDKNPINSPDAIIVQDNSDANISGSIGGASVAFTFDYDGNVQGGRTAGSDAVIVIRAIGLDTAQFVETNGTITRATGLSFSVVGGLERNYANA